MISYILLDVNVTYGTLNSIKFQWKNPIGILISIKNRFYSIFGKANGKDS